MYITPDQDHQTARLARKQFALLCHKTKATCILDRNVPTAILVPINAPLWWTPGDRRKAIAHARRQFAAAIRDILDRQA